MNTTPPATIPDSENLSVPKETVGMAVKEMLRASLEYRRASNGGSAHETLVAQCRLAIWRAVVGWITEGRDIDNIVAALDYGRTTATTDHAKYPDPAEREALVQAIADAITTITTATPEENSMPTAPEPPQQRTSADDAPVGVTHRFPVSGGAHTVTVRCVGLSDCIGDCSVPGCGWAWSDFSEPVSHAAIAVHAITHHDAVPEQYFDLLADVVEPRTAARIAAAADAATTSAEKAAEPRILALTSDRDDLAERLRVAKDTTRVEARRYANTTVRGEITRANGTAGLLAGVVVPGTGAAVVTGVIAALPRFAEIAGWSAAAVAGAIATLLVTVIRPRLAAGGTLGAVSTRPETVEEIATRLDTEHDELNAIVAAKNKRLNWAFRLVPIPVALAIVALALNGLGW